MFRPRTGSARLDTEAGGVHDTISVASHAAKRTRLDSVTEVACDSADQAANGRGGALTVLSHSITSSAGTPENQIMLTACNLQVRLKSSRCVCDFDTEANTSN